MTIWFNKKNNGVKRYYSKSISFNFYPQHFKIIKWFTNNAIKGKDSCYDFNLQLLGIFFSYTNWDY